MPTASERQKKKLYKKAMEEYHRLENKELYYKTIILGIAIGIATNMIVVGIKEALNVSAYLLSLAGLIILSLVFYIIGKELEKDNKRWEFIDSLMKEVEKENPFEHIGKDIEDV